MDINFRNLFHTGDDILSETSRYKVIDILGNGGNGGVFLVLCTYGKNKGCYFALKMFYQINSDERSIRFLQEIEFLKANKHISIIHHYDDGKHDVGDFTFPFVVTNYMPNTLEKELRKGVPMYRALLYTTQLLSALKHLQDLNILHRDIKPANIFINGPQAILGDFGLIKKLDIPYDTVDIKTISDNLYGDYSNGDAMAANFRTPQLVNYINGISVLNLKSDIFQLGLVLCLLFSGKNPLEKSLDKKSPIVLSSFGRIPSSKYGGQIFGLLRRMVNMDESSILSIDSLLDSWNSILYSYIKDQKDLDENIFSYY